MMTETPDPTRLPRIPLLLAVAAMVPAIVMPLVPPEYRPWNFAAFGAVAMFLAARGGSLGFPVAILLVMGGKLIADLLNYRNYHYDPEYLPLSIVYLGLLGYALCGSVVRRFPNSVPAIAGGILAGSVFFFLYTNFFDWVVKSVAYDSSLLGLLQSYEMALPFYRGTLLSDVGFTVMLFAAEAVLVRVLQPKLAPAKVTATEETIR